MAEVINLYESNFHATEQAGVVTVAARAGLELDYDKRVEFEATLAEAVGSAACSAAVVDLSQATFMDASGLQVVMRAKSAMQEQGKPLALDIAGPQTYSIQRLLEITGVVDHLFVITERPSDDQPGASDEPPTSSDEQSAAPKRRPFTVYSNPTPLGPGRGDAGRPRLRLIQGMGDAEATA